MTFLCPSVSPLFPSAHMNNVLTFCLLVTKSSTSLESLKACLDAPSSESSSCLRCNCYKWISYKWMGEEGVTQFKNISRCAVLCNTAPWILHPFSCRLALLAVFQVVLWWKEDDTLFLMQMCLFKLLLNSELKQALVPFSVSFTFILYLALQPLVSPPPAVDLWQPLSPASPLIRGSRPPLRDADASSMPECSLCPLSFLSLHHSVLMSAGNRLVVMLRWHVGVSPKLQWWWLHEGPNEIPEQIESFSLQLH